MRFHLVAVAVVSLGALGCGPKAAAPTTPPQPAATAPVSPAGPESTTGPESTEGPRALGFAPGDVAVIDWVRQPGQQGGHAKLRLPTGELLQGRWTEDSSADGRVVATDPSADPGDPASMPTGPAPASQFVIEMEGDRGTSVSCTIPTGRRAKTKIGQCHTSDARSFSARLR